MAKFPVLHIKCRALLITPDGGDHIKWAGGGCVATTNTFSSIEGHDGLSDKPAAPQIGN